MGRLGTLIRTWRSENGLTMSQAAERIGVSESEVSRLEAGKRPKMSVETIYKLSVALGQSMEEIRELTRQEEDSPRPSVATAPGRTA